MTKYLSSFATPTIRCLSTLIWTILVIVILLRPDNNTVTHDLSLSSFFATFFDIYSDLWDFIEAFIHIILFGVLTVLWYWTLIKLLPRQRALILAICIAVILGAGTEIGQYFVNRGSLLLDLLANYLGIALVSVWISLDKAISE